MRECVYKNSYLPLLELGTTALLCDFITWVCINKIELLDTVKKSDMFLF